MVLELAGVAVGSAAGRAAVTLGDSDAKIVKAFADPVGSGVWVGAYLADQLPDHVCRGDVPGLRVPAEKAIRLASKSAVVQTGALRPPREQPTTSAPGFMFTSFMRNTSRPPDCP